jgi:selenocysteine lyase/cysteine desulfurase
MIDMAAVCDDTPAAHDRVFLDSAGSSLPPTPVLAEVVEHLGREAEIGGYRAQTERRDDLDDGYGVFAELLDCAPEDIAFSDSATRSWLSAVDAVGLGDGDRVLISQVEYGANAVALYRLAELTGCVVERMPSDASGRIDVEATRELLDERVKLVSVVHVPTNSGLITPVAEITAAAHEVGALVLLDACQSVGQLPVRMRELGVDLITGTGRKWLRGPRGTGFLAVRKEIADWLRPRLVDHTGAELLGEDAFRLRGAAAPYGLYEYGVAERLGLIRAAKYLLELGVDEVSAAVLRRSESLRRLLDGVDGVRTLDPGGERAGIVSFAVDGIPAGEVIDALWAREIVVSGGSSPGGMLDMRLRGITEIVRASPHYFVTDDQLHTTAEMISTLVTGRERFRTG